MPKPSRRAPAKSRTPAAPEKPPETKPEAAGASRRVYLGILEDLEQHRMVPGQRLVETDLAKDFGVGRNAVREAMQRLAVRGVVDLSPNRSASIRKLDMHETLEVLEVATEMTSLAASIAARNFVAARHGSNFDHVMRELVGSEKSRHPGDFSRARRHFYRTLLSIGGNRELDRLFPAIGMHIIYCQFQSYALQQIRFADYRAIFDAVCSNNVNAAAAAGRAHVHHVRDVIIREVVSRADAADSPSRTSERATHALREMQGEL
jgi:DNA-binding GntR family transcriptional regulator